MAENVLARLMEHNNWANQQIIKACSTLTDEQLDAEPSTAVMGTVRETLMHFVRSQRGYLSLLTLPAEERPKTPIDFAELADSARASGEALLDLVSESRVPVKRLMTTDGYYVDPWVVLVQIINHATEHREQVKSMLSGLGVTPPSIDGWDFGEVTNALVPISS